MATYMIVSSLNAEPTLYVTQGILAGDDEEAEFIAGNHEDFLNMIEKAKPKNHKFAKYIFLSSVRNQVTKQITHLFNI